MVVGYKVGLKNSTQLIKSTFKVAHELRRPKKGLIFHTDRGSNYRSKSFGDYLKSLSVTQSFSRAHLPYDNSVVESFFSSLKREELYRTKYRSEKELRTAIDNYMLFYNEKRPHAKNGYKTPLRKETEYRECQKWHIENRHHLNVLPILCGFFAFQIGLWWFGFRPFSCLVSDFEMFWIWCPFWNPDGTTVKPHCKRNYNKTPVVVRTLGVHISTGVQFRPFSCLASDFGLFWTWRSF